MKMMPKHCWGCKHLSRERHEDTGNLLLPLDNDRYLEKNFWLVCKHPVAMELAAKAGKKYTTRHIMSDDDMLCSPRGDYFEKSKNPMDPYTI